MNELSGASVELLDIARLVLKQSGYRVATELIDGLPVLLAENEYFVVAVVQADSALVIPALDEVVSTYLRSRWQGDQLRSKRWDLYAVLLSEAPAPDEEALTVALTEIRQDTHSIRRVVRSDVDPTVPGLKDALRIFLPVGVVDDDLALEDPLAALQRLLPSHGTSEGEAARAIAAFRATGDVADG